MAALPAATFTASSPTTASVRAGSGTLVLMVLRSTMWRRSKRPSTRWPIISCGISTATDSSRLRAPRASAQPRDQRERRVCRELDYARDPIEREGAPDVGCRRLGTAVPHPVVLDDATGIDSWPGEAEAESAGHRGLGPSCVRRAVMARIPPHGDERASGRTSGA